MSFWTTSRPLGDEDGDLLIELPGTLDDPISATAWQIEASVYSKGEWLQPEKLQHVQVYGDRMTLQVYLKGNTRPYLQPDCK